MKKLLLAILFSVVGCSQITPYPVEPTPTPAVFRDVTPSLRGPDVLGLARQSLSRVRDSLLPHSAIGVLEGTFGPVVGPLDYEIAGGNVDAFRAHLTNGTCFRNHNCERGEPAANDLRSLGKRAAAFEALKEKYPAVACYLSPRLEHDETNKTLVNSWINTIHQFAPQCTVVISAFKGYVPQGVLVERHGNTAKGDIISNDGVSLFDANTDSYVNGGRLISFGWWYRLNLRTSGEKTWTPPTKRTARATSDEFNQARYLLVTPKPPIPVLSACPRARELKTTNEIWKTRSEDYNGKDPRENKPSLIVPGVYSKGFVISDPSGHTIGCLKYYGSYSGIKGTYRYYIGNCSGQNPEQLFIAAGNQEWVCLKNGNTQFAVSSLRRSGRPR